MRKFTVVIVALVLLVAPTAVVTGTQNWDEIAKTLGDIQVTLGNISTLIDQGALADVSEKLSMAELVRQSNIPQDIILLAQATPNISSGEYDGQIKANSEVRTTRDRASSSLTVKYDGAADISNRLFSLNTDVVADGDRNFTDLLFGTDEINTEISLDLALSTMFINDNFYLKITRGSDLFGVFDFSKYRNKWIVAEGMSPEGSSLNDGADAVENFWGDKYKRETEARNFLEAYVKHPIFAFEKIGDTRIDGRWYTTYRINIVTKNLVDFERAHSLASGQGHQALSAEERQNAQKVADMMKLSSTVAFDSSDYSLKRITSDVSFDMDADRFGGMDKLDPYETYNPELKSMNLTVSSDLKLSNINKSIRLDEPRNAIPLETVFSDLFGYTSY